MTGIDKSKGIELTVSSTRILTLEHVSTWTPNGSRGVLLGSATC
jgi:hypothetical protein